MMQRIDLTLDDGVRIAATEQAQDGVTTTAIILHGFYSSRHSANVTAALDSFMALGMNVIAPDLYGRGDSDGAFGDLTVTTGVATVRACIVRAKQYHPAKKIILTGGSYGGLLALHVAAQASVDALILRAPVSDWRAVWQQEIGVAALETWAETGAYAGTLPSGERVVFGRDFLHDLQSDDVYKGIASRITCPTLIVHGDADPVVPLAQSHRLHEALPHSELIVLPGADHVFSRPDDVTAYQAAIRDFLQTRDQNLRRI